MPASIRPNRRLIERRESRIDRTPAHTPTWLVQRRSVREKRRRHKALNRHRRAMTAVRGTWLRSISIQLRFHAALDAGARHQRVVPAAAMGEIRERHLVALVPPGPAEDRKVGDR